MRTRATSRCGDEALISQQFVDALREAIGLEPLYSNPERTAVERFASMPTYGDCGWQDGGRMRSKATAIA